jgi:hypothetical protein
MDAESTSGQALLEARMVLPARLQDPCHSGMGSSG